MIRKKRLQFFFLALFSFFFYLLFQHVDFQGYEDETFHRIRDNLQSREFKASRCGYGQILLETPFVYLGEKINTLLDGEKEKYLKFFTLAYNPFITALTVGIAFLLFTLFLKDLPALILTVAYAFATMTFPYAVIGMEPTSVFFIATAIYFLFRFGRTQKKIDIFLCGTFFFALLFSKSYYFITGPAFAFYIFLLFYSPQKFQFKKFLQSMLLLFSPLIIFIPLYLLGNNVSYGGYLKSPYVLQNELFGGEPFIFGLYGLLLSFGKSFFIYNPILFLTLFFFRGFYQKQRKEAIFIVLYSSLLLLFVSNVHWWSDETWGPRYLISLCLVWAIPLIAVFQANRWDNNKFRYVFFGLIIFSFLFQLLGASARYGIFPRTMKDLFHQTGHNTLTSGEYQYVPTFAPYWVNFRLIKNTVLNRKDPLNFRLIYSPPMEQNAEGKNIVKDITYKPPRETSVLDFWWRQPKNNKPLYFSILAGFVLIFLALYHFGRKLFRS